MKRSQRFLLTLIPVVCLPVYLTVFHAEPGRLARAHASQPALQEGLGRCDQCHTPAGIDAGCLACHEEIALQFDRERGYHQHLAQTQPESACATCHSEHRGEDFRPLNANSWPEGRDGFRHPHLDEFVLDAGRHREVMGECERCHNAERLAARPVPDRAAIRCQETFLGLDSDCERCHENPHRQGFSSDCLACHDQSQWKEANGFEHAQVFALDAAHAKLRCDQCHAKDDRDPVGPTQGKTCAACHQDPHPQRPGQLAFTRASSSCDSCHDASSFAAAPRYATQDHLTETFPLIGRHAETACRSCHRRVEDPQLVSLTIPADPGGVTLAACARCHVDVHADPTSQAVQLDSSQGCQACHDEHAWKPSRYDREQHAKTGFALEGSHARAECVRCHTEAEPPRPAGSPVRSCAACHEQQDPHRTPFVERCDGCHGTERLDWLGATLSTAQHALTQFPLEPPHQLKCAQCHTPGQPYAERYRAVRPDDCRSCHTDPHLAQFDTSSQQAGCRECHQDTRWTPSTFGLERHAQAGYPLVGGHVAAACTSCHRRYRRRVDGGLVSYRRFRRTSRACKSCHENPHGAQFARQLSGSGDCSRCHTDERSWRLPDFDHGATRFPLGASHRGVSCARCHPASDRATEGRRYRPIDPSCANCHADPHGGQFALDQPQVTDAGRCERCHTQDVPTWKLPAFDHDTTRFPLDGAHQSVACAACHRPYRVQDGRTIVRYRPLGNACKDCHGSFERPDEG